MAKRSKPDAKSVAKADRALASAPADGAKRQPRGEARRREILDATIELLAATGQRGLRLTDLANRLGITHSNLRYYFGSRQRLLTEAVQERERRESWFYNTPDDQVSLTEVPDAARLIRDNATFTRLYVVLGAESIDEDSALHDFFVRRYRRARRRMVTAIETDQKTGRIRADIDSEQISFEIISMLMGLEMQWLMDPDRVDYVGIVERYTAGLFDRFGTGDGDEKLGHE